MLKNISENGFLGLLKMIMKTSALGRIGFALFLPRRNYFLVRKLSCMEWPCMIRRGSLPLFCETTAIEAQMKEA